MRISGSSIGANPVSTQNSANTIDSASARPTAALRSAALNVYINVGAIKDEAFRADKLSELDNILSGQGALNEQIYGAVKAKLGSH